MTILSAISTICTVGSTIFFSSIALEIVVEVSERHVVLHLEDLLHLSSAEANIAAIKQGHAHSIIEKPDEW